MQRARYPALALALSALSACSGESPPPNVLLISIDTLRPDHLGCYGHDRDTSPAIDSLAERGVLFEDVTAASPWTLPSHASLLTGLYPSRHGVVAHVHRLKRGIPTLAGTLAERSYSTLAIVNSHNLSERYGLSRGFERFEYLPEIGPEGEIGNRGGEILELARRWLLERDGRPFFLFLHFYDVHTDFTPEAPYRERFVGPYAGAIDGTTRQLVDLRASGARLSADDVRHLRELYDAEIRELDDRLAGWMAFLEEQGLAADTLVVLTSDHGEEFMEHGSFLHGRTHYQEVIRVPLILSGPGLPSGVRITAPVHLVDVAPTVLALAGCPAPAPLDGIDLSTLWQDPGAAAPERLLFSEADHNNTEPDMRRMLRTPRYTLHYDRLAREMELYDLAADPGETVDVAGERAELAQELLRSLEAFMARETPGEVIGPPAAEDLERLRELGY